MSVSYNIQSAILDALEDHGEAEILAEVSIAFERRAHHLVDQEDATDGDEAVSRHYQTVATVLTALAENPPISADTAVTLREGETLRDALLGLVNEIGQ